MRTLGVTAVLLGLVLPLEADSGRPEEGLWAAARKGDVKAVEAALARGADVNAATSYGGTAIWFAAYKGHAPVVKALLEHMADPSRPDRVWGYTPLVFAVLNANPEVATLLVRAGAADSETALLTAAASGQAKVVGAIIEAGKIRPEVLGAASYLAPKGNKALAEVLAKAGARPPEKATEAQQELLAPYLVVCHTSNLG